MSAMSVGAMAGMDHGGMDHSQHGTTSMKPGPMATMDHGAAGMQAHPASETGNPLVDMQTMNPVPKLDDPGIGLRDTGRRVLTYADLRITFPDPAGLAPGREIALPLTGPMEPFPRSFAGLTFSDSEPFPHPSGDRSHSL